MAANKYLLFQINNFDFYYPKGGGDDGERSRNDTISHLHYAIPALAAAARSYSKLFCRAVKLIDSHSHKNRFKTSCIESRFFLLLINSSSLCFRRCSFLCLLLLPACNKHFNEKQLNYSSILFVRAASFMKIKYSSLLRYENIQIGRPSIDWIRNLS